MISSMYVFGFVLLQVSYEYKNYKKKKKNQKGNVRDRNGRQQKRKKRRRRTLKKYIEDVRRSMIITKLQKKEIIHNDDVDDGVVPRVSYCQL